MPREDNEEVNWECISELIRAARDKSRGYATYWEWAPNRSQAEVGVVSALAEHLSHSEGCNWKSLQPIEDDPPDVLLVSVSGKRIGVEVTELVDGATIERHRFRLKSGENRPNDWANWDRESLIRAVERSVQSKDKKLAKRAEDFDELYVAIATDEPMIDLAMAQESMSRCLVCTKLVQRAFLLLSYLPGADSRLFPNGIPVISVPLQISRDNGE